MGEHDADEGGMAAQRVYDTAVDEGGWQDGADEDHLGDAGATPPDLGAANPSPNPFGADDATEAVDLDELAEQLMYSEPEQAETEVRAALKVGDREPSEPDVLGGLLKVFRLVRAFAMEEGDWESRSTAKSYCDHLTSMCDRNFMTALGGEGNVKQDLPPAAVAAVYAECGRTLALADELPRAKDRLEKALNVFGIVQDKDEPLQRQVAATGASLARVLRRLGLEQLAHKGYVDTLQKYENLVPGLDTADFIGEYCEFLGEVGGDYLSPVTLALISELAEIKFGDGSDEHLEVLKSIGEACESAGRLELAGAALLRRAELIRERAGSACSLAEVAAIDAADDAAARAREAAVPHLLEAGDLASAAQAWADALRLRESIEGEGSETCVQMRASLEVLRAAASAKAEADGVEDQGSGDAAEAQAEEAGDVARSA